MKYHDSQAKQAQVTGKQVTRTREEAEALLRIAIKELRQDCEGWKQKPKGPADVVAMSSPKFMSLCRKLSECETSKHGGSMCGDLGWVTPQQRSNMGGTFKEVTDALLPGSWSDIAASGQGLHLIQRLA